MLTCNSDFFKVENKDGGKPEKVDNGGVSVFSNLLLSLFKGNVVEILTIPIVF